MQNRLLALSLAASLPIASTLCAQVTPAAPTVAPRAVKATQNAQTTADAPAAAAKPAEVDEKAKAIYEKGIAAARALKSIDFVSQTKLDMPGVDPSMLPPGMGGKYRVAMTFGEADGGAFMIGGKLCLERLADKAEPGESKVAERFVATKDSAILVDPVAKTYATADSWMGLGGRMMMALPQWLFEARAAGNADMEEGGMVVPRSTIVAASMVGTETIDDIECDVVKVTRELDLAGMVEEGSADEMPEGMPAKLRLIETVAFAQADALPRRIAMMPEMPEMPEMDGMGGDDGAAQVVAAGPATVWTSVRVNPDFSADTFSTTPPEGFTKVDPPENSFGGPTGAGMDAERPEPELKVKLGEAAPAFALKDLAGTEVSLESLKGKVVLLDFWATWCGPCKAAMPVIQKLHDEYASKGVAVLGVNTWEQQPDAAKKYIESKKYTYPCLLSGDSLAEAYGVPGIPTLVVIGKDGKVAAIEIGLADATGAGLRKAIDEALAK